MPVRSINRCPIASYLDKSELKRKTVTREAELERRIWLGRLNPRGVGWLPRGTSPPQRWVGNLACLYDNILTATGGAATAGFFGPFDDIPGTQAFVDWVNTPAQWSDELHNISAGTGLPAVVQTIYYGYRNEVATTTHIIKIYDMVFPSAVPTFSTLIQKGALLASVVLPANPTGTFMVTVSGLDIHVPQSAVWIKFAESGPGFPGTF